MVMVELSTVCLDQIVGDGSLDVMDVLGGGFQYFLF